MSHLKVHIVQHAAAIKRPGELLATIDVDQLVRVPVVGDIIDFGNGEYKVEKVKIFPNHGATLTVIG